MLECADGLTRRGFKVLMLPTLSEANRSLTARIGRNRNVYYSGSTLEELGILETLKALGNLVKNSSTLTGSWGVKVRRPRKLTSADVFLSSASAITLDGIIINPSCDGVPLFSKGLIPGEIIIVAGHNKIVDDLSEGLRRARDVSFPAAAKNLGLDIPCVKKGRCVECDNPHPICSVNTVITRKPLKPDILVALIAEKLGH